MSEILAGALEATQKRSSLEGREEETVGRLGSTPGLGEQGGVATATGEHRVAQQVSENREILLDPVLVGGDPRGGDEGGRGGLLAARFREDAGQSSAPLTVGPNLLSQGQSATQLPPGQGSEQRCLVWREARRAG